MIRDLHLATLAQRLRHAIDRSIIVLGGHGAEDLERVAIAVPHVDQREQEQVERLRHDRDRRGLVGPARPVRPRRELRDRMPKPLDVIGVAMREFDRGLVRMRGRGVREGLPRDRQHVGRATSTRLEPHRGIGPASRDLERDEQARQRDSRLLPREGEQRREIVVRRGQAALPAVGALDLPAVPARGPNQLEVQEVAELAGDLDLRQHLRPHAAIKRQQPPRAGREAVTEPGGPQVAERLVPRGMEVPERVVVPRVGERELAEPAAVGQRGRHGEAVGGALQQRQPQVHEDRRVHAPAFDLDPAALVLRRHPRAHPLQRVVPDPEAAKQRARSAAVEGEIRLGLEAGDERGVRPVERTRDPLRRRDASFACARVAQRSPPASATR